MRAQDVLSDDQSTATFNGVSVRKGTIAAFIFNAKMIADDGATPEARAAAERDILEDLPALRATGLFDVMRVHDERVRRLVGQRPDSAGQAA